MIEGLNKRVCYGAGDIIFKQGEDGSEAFYLESGKVELSHLVDGEKQVVNVLGPGTIFGEMALIADKTRLLTATALENAQCYKISEEFMRQQIDESTPFIRALLRVITSTVQRLQENS